MELTKKELLDIIKDLLAQRSMYSISGINQNSSKAEIMNAIKCLECDDEQMMNCLEIVKKLYPNIYLNVTNNETDFESFKYHSHHRLYIYNLSEY